MEAEARTLERDRFDDLLTVLRERGYEVIGPTVGSGAIGMEPVTSSAELPVGITEEQEGGSYRLRDRGDGALFGFSTGPQAWKRWLHPPAISVWSAERDPDSGGLAIRGEQEREEVPRRAFLGVRSCDLHAIRSLDDALLNVEHPDPTYSARRERTLIVAVNCSTAGGTCFCVSMRTGPRAESGFDLALTEVIEDGRHYFVCESGSEAGQELLEALPTSAAETSEREAGERVVERTAASMGRELETEGLKELLDRNLEHPRWDEVSERCLTCGNCTQVCPTCFCTDVEDVAALDGMRSERRRRWDSCFTLGFTYVHGGSVRSSARSRYRQWMTHKLSTWLDQFDESSGCVGCGRCISWCPVAIDITEEAAAIRASDGEVR
jgi:sulfhydrogenase subunit beta (sulfur reductase)